MGTANTAWKLTDLWNAALFTFDSDGGWHPTNENHTPELTGEMYNIPWDNLVQRFDYGLGGRQISLQGVDVANEDLWKLSSAICQRQLMKLWVGEDWFYYVLGQEPRQIRDQSLPYQKSYLASFIAMDPHYYFANSTAGGTDATINQVGPTTVIGSAWSFNISNLVIDLTATGSNEGTTGVEPCYWIIGGASTSITKITIYDLNRRKIEYAPTTPITSGHVHVIMPYRNTMIDGFVVNDMTGFRVRDGTGNSYVTEPAGIMGSGVSVIGTWAMDAFNHGFGTDVNATAAANMYRWVYEENACIPSLNEATYIPRSRYYPHMDDGKSGNHAVTATGTITDAKVFAQYCVRRV